MTVKKARPTLRECQAQIDRNVADYIGGRIDYETFGLRQALAHSLIDASGQRDAFLRRWRRKNPVGGIAA